MRAECERSYDPSALVAAFDEVAWDAQDAEERGGQPEVSYDEAFRRARAADAWRQAEAVTDVASACEAVYEAVHAFGGDSDAENHVVSVLSA